MTRHLEVFLVVLLLLRGSSLRRALLFHAEGCPTLTNMLVIIVGGIPIAMPTVLSVTLALGAYKLAKEGAIVARMSAVEEMAGMDILCSDKTGAFQALPAMLQVVCNISRTLPLMHTQYNRCYRGLGR